MAALWVYKCNVNAEAEGDWHYFFDTMRGRGRWGGTASIKNAASLRILREELQAGDLVLAWQTDERAALGLCRVSGLDRDGDDISIILKSVHRFRQPVKLLQWKKRSPALENGQAFIRAKQGTLFETTTEEAEEILEICRVPKKAVRQKSQHKERRVRR